MKFWYVLIEKSPFRRDICSDEEHLASFKKLQCVKNTNDIIGRTKDLKILKSVILASFGVKSLHAIVPNSKSTEAVKERYEKCPRKTDPIKK